ncbi:Syntaxin-6_N domain-containing protein [Hirschfeldia incana]|nr:Syntaxin-6_N domain-containing protein [Hirschfeldia incana]
MMVVNSFDLWQKDVFFSAAEEVQKSADIMESAYRLWIREKKDDIFKELQAALGTAKWQLEEFEKAVRLSHRQCGDDSTTTTRHKQFVAAIENQIHRVETSLQETYTENGKEPLRWVNLSEEERDDLAMFLSGSSLTSQSFSSESSIKSSVAEVTGNGNGSECVIDIQESVKPRNAEKTAGTRRTWSSPDFSSLRIIVPGDHHEQEGEKLVTQIEATPKVKGTKSILWIQRLPDHTQLGCFQNPIRLSFNHPIKLTVSIMLMVFLLLPFVVYSS